MNVNLFKLKYNVLTLMQVSISLVSSILLLKSFGISVNSDAYFMALSIYIVIQFLQITPLELYLQYHHEIKTTQDKEFNTFFSFIVFSALLIGIMSIIILYLLDHFIIYLFANGFDNFRKEQLLQFLHITFYTLTFYPLQFIFERYLVAEEQYGKVYAIGLITPFLIFVLQIFIFFIERLEIKFLLYALVVGNYITIGVFIFLIFIKKRQEITLTFWMSKSADFFISSSKMRLAINIHNIFFQLLINHALSSLAVGAISTYNYALKIVSIVNNIILGPSYNIITNKISSLWHKSEFIEMKNNINIFLQKSTLLFLGCSIVVYIFLPHIFLFFPNITMEMVITISSLFVLLSINQLLAISIHPYVGIISVMKKSNILLFGNILFIFILFLLLNINKPIISVEYIPVSIIISSIFVMWIHIGYPYIILKKAILNGKSKN